MIGLTPSGSDTPRFPRRSRAGLAPGPCCRRGRWPRRQPGSPRLGRRTSRRPNRVSGGCRRHPALGRHRCEQAACGPFAEAVVRIEHDVRAVAGRGGLLELVGDGSTTSTVGVDAEFVGELVADRLQGRRRGWRRSRSGACLPRTHSRASSSQAAARWSAREFWSESCLSSQLHVDPPVGAGERLQPFRLRRLNFSSSGASSGASLKINLPVAGERQAGFCPLSAAAMTTSALPAIVIRAGSGDRLKTQTMLSSPPVRRKARTGSAVLRNVDVAVEQRRMLRGGTPGVRGRR